MPKVSKPIIYVGLGAVVIAALVLTQPPAPTTTSVTQHYATRTAQASDPNGILAADLKAHFPRYTGGVRDPFTPGVALARPKTVARAGSESPLSGRSGWALTGINSVNGVASALIENATTGDSVFLQPGDRWNGLHVVSIQSDRVLFQNALGHQDALTFAQPPDDTGAGGGPAPGASLRLPSGVTPLPPYPVSPLPVTPLPGSRASLPALPPLSGVSQAPTGNNFGPQGSPGGNFPFPGPPTDNTSFSGPQGGSFPFPGPPPDSAQSPGAPADNAPSPESPGGQ